MDKESELVGQDGILPYRWGEARSAVCCVVVRSTIIRTICAAPIVTGTIHTIGTTMWVFVLSVRSIVAIINEGARYQQCAWRVIKLISAVHGLLDSSDHDRLPPVVILVGQDAILPHKKKLKQVR